MTQLIAGVIHGKTIELQADPGLGDGQRVEVLVRPAPHRAGSGEGIRRTAGALAGDLHWDVIMDEIHQARKRERRPQVESE